MVESHLDLVQHGGLAAADFIGLPERGDFGQHGGLALQRFGIGKRKAVERLQFARNAPSLEMDHPARHVGGMGGKHRDNQNPPQPVQRLFGADPGSTHAQQGAPQGTGLARLSAGKPGRAPAPSAMICFSQVGQLEVGGEGLDDPVSLGGGHGVDNPHRPFLQFTLSREIEAGLALAVIQLAVADRQVAQLLLGGKGLLTGLLPDDRAQKPSQGTDVPSQRNFP